jgi:formylglycine-generating enzyme
MKKRFLAYLILLIFILTPVLKASETDDLLKQAVELIKIDKLDWALDLVREVIKKDPANPKSYHCAGMIYFKKKDYNTSIKEYDIAISLKPDYGVAYYNLGLNYEKIGKYKEASKAFMKARDLYKDQNNTKDYEDAVKKIKDLDQQGVSSVTTPEINTEDMVYIEQGEFWMGSDENDSTVGTDEKPKHKVYIDSYWIDKYEVTNGQYCKFLNDKGKDEGDGQKWLHPGDKKGEGKIKKIGAKYIVVTGYENYPVTFVTWYGASSYAGWAGKRLPTEAEWEKAARGTDGRVYPWGNDWNKDKCANQESSSGRESKSAASYPGGTSPYGVMDMAGNVMEWCADWYGLYSISEGTIKNPKGPFYSYTKVVKGGSWDDNYWVCRCAFRGNYSPDDYDNDIGFRCVKSGK